MKITTYTKKDGSTVYRASIFLGIDSVTGKKVKTTVSARTKRELEQKARRKIIDFEKAGSTVYQTAAITTYQELVSLWLDSYRLTVKPQTFAVTQSKINHHLLPVFGTMRLNKIRPSTIQAFVNSIAPKLVNFKEVAALNRRILQYGVILQLIPYNPARDLILPKQQKASRESIKFIEPNNLKALMTHLENKSTTSYKNFYHFVIFKLLLATGCRIGELTALDWSDIDLTAQTVSINKTYSSELGQIGDTKTKSGQRVISIDRKTSILLKQYLNRQRLTFIELGQPAPAVVFATPVADYFHRSSLQGLLDRLCHLLNIQRFTLHAFRHTHASLLLNAGISYKELQHRLGHATLSMTMDIYGHLSKEKEKEAATYFEKAMSGL